MMDKLQIPFSHHFQNEDLRVRRQGVFTDGKVLRVKEPNPRRDGTEGGRPPSSRNLVKVLTAIADLLRPISECLAAGHLFKATWKAPGPWRK